MHPLRKDKMHLVHLPPESAFLGILVEGGILYFVIHSIFLVFIFKDISKYNKKYRNNERLILSLFLFVTCIALNIFNDYYSTFYWILLALICGTIVKSKRGNLLNDEIKEKY